MKAESAVVILNWNGAHHLAEFLPSVVENTPAQIDVVVADNGSSDNSVEFVRQNFERVKVVELAQNYGFAQGYNLALQGFDYEFVVLLNSDVKVAHGWITPLLDALRSDDRLAAVSPKLRSYAQPDYFEYAGASGGFIDLLGYPFCRGRILQNIERDCGQYDDMCEVMWVSGAAFACRLSLFKELGGFDPHFFAHMEEIDLCWRLALKGYRVAIVPQSVVYHLGAGTLEASSPRKVFFNHRNNLAMLYKCAPSSQRLLVAIVRPMLDMAAAFSYLIKGQGRSFVAVFKAYRDFIAWHPRLQRERRAIRSAAVGEATTIYQGSILLQVLKGVRRYSDINRR